MECVHDHSLDALAREQFEMPSQQRPVSDANEDLRNSFAELPEARSLPGGENDRVHRRLGSGLFGDA
jgi:hypothetical protein